MMKRVEIAAVGGRASAVPQRDAVCGECRWDRLCLANYSDVWIGDKKAYPRG